jgi:precorrin-6B C5,15-methyltransferase / cobalt-precorrin-6B C5,C15-methyltransferase
MKMASIIHIFGLDNTTRDYSKIQSVLKTSAAIVSGKRLYDELAEQFEDDALPQLIAVVPLTHCITSIKECLDQGDVVVLASGDPLFFGIGRRLIHSFPGHEIRVHPALSSMQLVFARFNLPWDDAEFVSLHGRGNEHLAARLLKHPKVFLFTDPANSPSTIAEKLLEECGEGTTADVTCHVGECLGSPVERLCSGTLSEIAAMHFADPNVMILLNPTACSQSKKYPSFGLQEKEICHSRGLLTKNEVRAAAIHALRLPQDGVFWDVGAGSGSVGLEAARLFPDLHVLSIEKEEEQWQNIAQNKTKFRAWNMNLVKGDAPGALQHLPAPARVFIGGSGGNLQCILEVCAEKLLPGGIVVVNAVLEKTARLAPDILYRLGFDVEIRKIAVQRFRYPEEEKQHFNPIKIIVGSKPMQESGDE